MNTFNVKDCYGFSHINPASYTNDMAPRFVYVPVSGSETEVQKRAVCLVTAKALLAPAKRRIHAALRQPKQRKDIKRHYKINCSSVPAA